MIKDKVAIVTGASSGIGYATALALSRSGAKVAAGARRMDRLESLRNEISKNGEEVFVQKLDVTAFSEGLRQEFSQRSNIRVTCIEPGVVATELMEAITDKALEKYVERTRQMEALQAEDIASAIMFAVEAPRHVNVNEILIRPMTQER